MVVLCCSLRGGFARAAGWSDGFSTGSEFLCFCCLLRPPQASSNTGVGSNPVWRALGHNEPVDGRVQTWTRHVSDQLSASEHRQDMFTGRSVKGSVAINPIEMGEGAVSERPPVLTVSGNPLATRHTHVTTTGCRQLDRSRRKGSQRDPILWIPFLCIQSDRTTRVGEGVSWKGTSLVLWFPYWLSRFVTGEARRTFRLRRTYAVRTREYAERTQDGCPAGTPTQGWSSLSTAVVSWTFLSTWLVSQFATFPQILGLSESRRQSHSKLRPHQMSQTGGWVRSSV